MTAHTLAGKTALVTGSTSGIGLGIARALAAAGANVMLNGFGNAAEVERTRAALAEEFSVKALYSGADMSRAEADPSQLTDDDYGMANLVLFNGARFYVDHAHPEYSSPEVTNPRDAALWDAAGDRIMERSAELASVTVSASVTPSRIADRPEAATPQRGPTCSNASVQRAATWYSPALRSCTAT